MTRINDESKYYNKIANLADRRIVRQARYEPVRDVIPGIVYTVNGSFYVAGRGETYVYVHEFGAYAPGQAYKPPGIIVWDGAGVLMMRSPKPPYGLEIIGTHVSPYPRSVVSSTQIGRTDVSIHGENHQWPTDATKGIDPVKIWSPALQMLKAVPSETNMEVTVGPLAYLRGSIRYWFPTETVDLTSYIPAAGKVVCVLLSLDTATGTIAVTSGATADDPFGTFHSLKPDTPIGNIPSGYFYLRGGMTTLDVLSDYLDARLWLGSSSSGGVSQNELAHAEEELDYLITDHIVNHPSGGAGTDLTATHHFLYEFDSSTSTSPGNGEVRLNHATPASVTSIYLDYTDREGNDQSYLITYMAIGDYILLKSEVDDDYLIYEIREVIFPGGYVEYVVQRIDESGGIFADGEPITITQMHDQVSYATRDRVHRATHVDGTWYAVDFVWIGQIPDRTMGLDYIITGHSDDAATASWMYQVYCWGRNDGGVITGGFTVTDITEYDAAYEARGYVSGVSLGVQIRRVGGTDYDIYWAASGRQVAY